MPTAVAVVACALALLGRSERTFPPIQLVDVLPIDASPQTEAFVRVPGNVIYVVTTSPVFRAVQNSSAQCGDLFALKKLASVLAHEEWHVRHGTGERAAYEAQLTALIQMGIPPDSRLYIGVVRSMLEVLKRQKEKPELVVAKGK
jgi:hypothetical protein